MGRTYSGSRPPARGGTGATWHAGGVDDKEVIGRIDQLVEEEHRLRSHASSEGTISDKDRKRLHELEVGLDQCWDLLRQRRARKHAGQDPADVVVREEGVVEGYQQ